MPTLIKRHGQQFAAHAILHLGRVNFSLRTVIALEKFKPSAESISIKDVDLVDDADQSLQQLRLYAGKTKCIKSPGEQSQ